MAFGKGSKTSYPPKTGHNNGSIPPAGANASNGKLTGHGSKDTYPSKQGGNKWPAPGSPGERARATEGTLGGHASGKQTYPAKGGHENKRFCPTGGNRL